MGDDRSKADKLDRSGEEPTAESGAGYGSHAPSPEEKGDEAQPGDPAGEAP